MYYCDMGPNGSVIRAGVYEVRRVGQYVIVQGDHMPTHLEYRAHAIVSHNKAQNTLVWVKHKDRQPWEELTAQEQVELTLQILQSEVWERRLK